VISRLKFCLLSLLWSNFFNAQVNLRFAKHLSDLNLRNEHLAYINSLPIHNDSTYYLKACYFLKYFNDTLFLTNYKASIALCHADTSLLKLASIHFLDEQLKFKSTRWFDQKSHIEYINSIEKFGIINSLCVNPNLRMNKELPEDLQPSFLNYKKVYNKKPLLAASISCLIPGLGKLYAGKKKAFVSTFLINAVFATQATESIIKAGVRHPLSIINIGAFSVFYLSNIYGSYKAVIQLRNERKQQFIFEATNFYN
jgi:TM2 domain-containing membrane protein YozV